jgi:hypothetical protein
VPRTPEPLAQLIQQISFVGKVERARDVRETHELPRRDAGLRRVQDSDLPPARAGGRLHRGHIAHEPVHFRCRHAFHACCSHYVDHLEQTRRSLPGCGGIGSIEQEQHPILCSPDFPWNLTRPLRYSPRWGRFRKPVLAVRRSHGPSCLPAECPQSLLTLRHPLRAVAAAIRPARSSTTFGSSRGTGCRVATSTRKAVCRASSSFIRASNDARRTVMVNPFRRSARPPAVMRGVLPPERCLLFREELRAGGPRELRNQSRILPIAIQRSVRPATFGLRVRVRVQETPLRPACALAAP